MTDAAYRLPNVRARLRRTRTAPGTTPTETVLTIWLRDSVFRVRDEAGRPYSDVAADVRSARGFGRTPRTMEEFMDAADRARRLPGPPTELYGDLDTGDGLVCEPGAEPWEVVPAVLLPVAAQLLADGREASLVPTGHPTYLGRPCAEYRFPLTGEEDGVPYRSEVRWVVSEPYLLVREVSDGGLHVLVETVELAEGVVTEADVRP
jgi:hypothetical protein